MSIEAMKQAVEALALFASDESDEGQMAIAAHEALRQAIGQAENQEPVAWGMVSDGEIYDCITPAEHDRAEGKYNVPLYAAYGWQSVVNPTEYLDDLRGGADE